MFAENQKNLNLLPGIPLWGKGDHSSAVVVEEFL